MLESIAYNPVGLFTAKAKHSYAIETRQFFSGDYYDAT